MSEPAAACAALDRRTCDDTRLFERESLSAVKRRPQPEQVCRDDRTRSRKKR